MMEFLKRCRVGDGEARCVVAEGASDSSPTAGLVGGDLKEQNAIIRLREKANIALVASNNERKAAPKDEYIPSLRPLPGSLPPRWGRIYTNPKRVD
jgi:hypothetical protein